MFLCDVDETAAVESLYTTARKNLTTLTAAGSFRVDAARVRKIPSASSQRVYEPLPLSGATFRAAIGRVQQDPISGVFTVGFGTKTSGTLTATKRYRILDFNSGDNFTNVGAGSNADGVVFTASGTTPTTWSNGSTLTEITADLAFDVSPASLETALNAMASVAAAGNVDVTTIGGAYVITFLVAGTRAEITAYTASLAPSGTIAEIGTLLDGATTIIEAQTLRLVQSPPAFVDLTDESPGPAGSVTSLVTGAPGPPAVNAKYLVKLHTVESDGRILNQPHGGRWSITIAGEESEPIAWDATSEVAQAAIEAMAAVGAGNVTVIRETGTYLIVFKGDHAGENMGTITVDCSALDVVKSMGGVLALNTPGVRLLFADGAETAEVEFAIECTPAGGERAEIHRQDLTLRLPVIPDGALAPNPVIGFYNIVQADAATAGAIAALSFGTMATQNKTAVDIEGGTLDGVTITNIVGDITLAGTLQGTVNDITIVDAGGGGLVVQNTADSTLLQMGAASTIIVDAGAQLSVNMAGPVTFSNLSSGGTSLDIGPGGTLASGAFAAIRVGANPTGTIGLAAVNGVATTFMRSDAAPPISQAIAPTWTQPHIWSNSATFNGAVTISPAAGTVAIAPTATGNIQNMAIGGATPAGGRFTSMGVGPAATPGTTFTRLKHGLATLVAGTVTVGESTITASTRIQLTAQSLGTVSLAKALAVTARVNAASFTITSADSTDSSVIAYTLIEP